MFIQFLNFSNSKFSTIVEVVPPLTYKIDDLISKLNNLKSLSIDAFSIANNPLLKPRLDALISSFLIQKGVERHTILHCITRDINRIAIQSKLLAARALNINTVLVMTGDLVSSFNKTNSVKTVQDVDVFRLITYARKAGFQTGVVLGNIENNQKNIEHLKKKIDYGAQFVITQPIYCYDDLEKIKYITSGLNIPVIIGIMPLQNERNARFLNTKVSGISIPVKIINRMSKSKNKLAEGISIASETIHLVQKYFNGICIMPQFNQFDSLHKLILSR